MNILVQQPYILLNKLDLTKHKYTSIQLPYLLISAIFHMHISGTFKVTWKGWRYISELGGLFQGCTSFPRILKPPQNCRDQKGNTKLVPYWGSTNIRCQLKKHPRFVHPWIIFIPGLNKKSSLRMKSILMLEHQRERCCIPWGKFTVEQINTPTDMKLVVSVSS
jgi:hypothetical protein